MVFLFINMCFKIYIKKEILLEMLATSEREVGKENSRGNCTKTTFPNWKGFQRKGEGGGKNLCCKDRQKKINEK